MQVSTHPHLIQTVLTRLLDNAAKFTHLGSITLSLKQEGDRLHFSIADTGPGIPADKRDFIFERFAKLDSFAQGTGLGLSVARMIAERLGGTLTLDSDYTGGSKFDLIIPASFKS
jgi:signal transduction histidine kinase